MDEAALDLAVRQAAFRRLDALRARHGDRIPRAELLTGFEYGGNRIALISAQRGIFKPAILPTVPLSILTTAVRTDRPRPYEDEVGPDGFLRYRYFGTDPRHRDNVGLREAFRRQTPLIYFHGIAPGVYVAAYPVVIVGDDPSALTVTVAVDSIASGEPGASEPGVAESLRRYGTRQTLQRLHQAEFRQHVLRAYAEQCAICRLRHSGLLDAAHIIPDTEPGGEPVVPNGLALCKLHHAAFDQNVLGIRPDMVVEVRGDILLEIDGPMLQHGIQGAHEQALVLPRRKDLRPDPDRLSVRYRRFREAG
jgi:putative restriction endonuclease